MPSNFLVALFHFGEIVCYLGSFNSSSDAWSLAKSVKDCLNGDSFVAIIPGFEKEKE